MLYAYCYYQFLGDALAKTDRSLTIWITWQTHRENGLFNDTLNQLAHARR